MLQETHVYGKGIDGNQSFEDKGKEMQVRVVFYEFGKDGARKKLKLNEKDAKDALDQAAGTDQFGSLSVRGDSCAAFLAS